MKSKALQRIVERKVLQGKTPSEILSDIGPEEISLVTIKRWSAKVKTSGSILLNTSSGRPRTARRKINISKIKKNINAKGKNSARKVAHKIGISERSVRRALKQDLGLFPFKKRKEPALKDEQKLERKQFAKWAERNLTKKDRLRVVFSDEKYFEIDGVYNANNDRIWAVNRKEADKTGGIFRKSKFPQKVMVWMAVCSTGATKLYVVTAKTMKHPIYIKKCLPLAKKMGDKEFGGNWGLLHIDIPKASSGAQITYQIFSLKIDGPPTHRI